MFNFPTTPQEVENLLWGDEDWAFILEGPYDCQVVNVESVELSTTDLVVVVVSVSLFRPEGRRETYVILPNGEYRFEVAFFATSKPCDYDHTVNPYKGWSDKIKLV